MAPWALRGIETGVTSLEIETDEAKKLSFAPKFSYIYVYFSFYGIQIHDFSMCLLCHLSISNLRFVL